MKYFNLLRENVQLSRKLKDANIELGIYKQERDKAANVLAEKLRLEAKAIELNMREVMLNRIEGCIYDGINLVNLSKNKED